MASSALAYKPHNAIKPSMLIIPFLINRHHLSKNLGRRFSKHNGCLFYKGHVTSLKSVNESCLRISRSEYKYVCTYINVDLL